MKTPRVGLEGDLKMWENLIEQPEFKQFPKMARLSRECLITEKLDGTNGQIYITEDGRVFAGSRNRWVTPDNDNYGFAAWVEQNKKELLKLGPGRHFGEWWGLGIQRGYGLAEKRFSLFNVLRFNENPQMLPDCCSLVPILYRGPFSSVQAEHVLQQMGWFGSHAAPGFMRPEGVIVYHVAAGVGFKKTLGNDGHKGKK